MAATDPTEAVFTKCGPGSKCSESHLSRKNPLASQLKRKQSPCPDLLLIRKCCENNKNANWQGKTATIRHERYPFGVLLDTVVKNTRMAVMTL
jgi:hypothetical protein